jgi:hypothetical protein
MSDLRSLSNILFMHLVLPFLYRKERAREVSRYGKEPTEGKARLG